MIFFATDENTPSFQNTLTNMKACWQRGERTSMLTTNAHFFSQWCDCKDVKMTFVIGGIHVVCDKPIFHPMIEYYKSNPLSR